MAWAAGLTLGRSAFRSRPLERGVDYRSHRALSAAFTFTVTRGGPGATLVLDVSGLTFNETVLEGQIAF